ncbi:class I SAM-dependent methyltransferase [Legionella cincinnatiensis]|uniref:O-methyltransferase n=1 Tax=Legionella cincinnatiensis TaxID=28085 RepID=A0A378IFR1_9GAMM|nr:class I SAM-dependent methyltransferase [Legionella cincinnatiensis]KTC92121.1 O-methyltransferase [Legionella cincinnatiensis]STX33575.1 O-methyltransferase [Legionella cincinnatiensis]
MNGELKKYSQIVRQLGFAVKHQCLNESEVRITKQNVLDGYNSWAHKAYNKAFLNWGLWDKKVYNEYSKLDFNFSTICNIQDIYAQLLIYYLISPLIKKQLYSKRLLEIGCGNGIGVRVCSELLKTRYALGVDLVPKLTHNANSNFYKENSINYISSDAENLPLANESFDIVTNLESSHLYPQIEHFFSEVERILIPGGFFCYADIHIDEKNQEKRLEAFINSRKNLKVIQKNNITKMVRSAIYERIITRENEFYLHAQSLFGQEPQILLTEIPALAEAMGLSFLPWWKIRFKTPLLQPIGKNIRKRTYWGGKKCFFYYLIQKVFE